MPALGFSHDPQIFSEGHPATIGKLGFLRTLQSFFLLSSSRLAIVVNVSSKTVANLALLSFFALFHANFSCWSELRSTQGTGPLPPLDNPQSTLSKSKPR